MDNPILRATMSSGATWDDPSEDLLFILLSDIEEGAEEYVVVHRLGSEQTYAQATVLGDSTFLIEYRDGSADRHFAAESSDKRVVHAAMTGWAFQLPGWQDLLEWRPAGI